GDRVSGRFLEVHRAGALSIVDNPMLHWLDRSGHAAGRIPTRSMPVRRSPGDSPLLEVRDLTVSFRSGSGHVAVTRDVGFGIAAGERLGVVGESGCGKPVTGLSILGLLP